MLLSLHLSAERKGNPASSRKTRRWNNDPHHELLQWVRLMAMPQQRTTASLTALIMVIHERVLFPLSSLAWRRVILHEIGSGAPFIPQSSTATSRDPLFLINWTQNFQFSRRFADGNHALFPGNSSNPWIRQSHLGHRKNSLISRASRF